MRKIGLLSFAVWVILFNCFSYADMVVPFHGKGDLSKESFDVFFDFKERGFVKLGLTQSHEGQHGFFIDFEKFNALGLVFSVGIRGLMELTQASPDGLSFDLLGKIWSQYTLVNYKPVRQLAGNFALKNNRLTVHSLILGPIACEGTIDFEKPYKLNMTVKVQDVAMGDFLRFWMGVLDFETEGAVSGVIQLSGSLGRLFLKGQLKSQGGYIDDFQYDSIDLHAEGIYPVMQITDSVFSEKGGFSFNLGGRFNLNDRANYQKQIMALEITPLVTRKGKEMKWTIKQLKDEDTGNAEIKYFFRKTKPVDSSEETRDILGVERVVEF